MRFRGTRATALAAVLLFLAPQVRPVRAQSIAATAEQCLGGQLDAPIRIDIFSDFQCPSCAVFYLETVRPILKEYAAASKVCVVYHEFPLPMHAHSRAAARWSIAAQKLGRKQWVAVVEALYSQQAKWSQDGKVEAAAASALSSEDYMAAKRFLLLPEVDQIIDRDVALGNQLKVESTPTCYVYSIGREQKVVGGLPFAVLKDFFDRIVR